MKKPIRQFYFSRAGGFSLVEVLIVVTIIAILAGAAIPFVQDYLDEARRARAKNDLDEIRNALIRYEISRRTEYIGSTVASLIGPFLSKAITDPWGAEYRISNASSTVYCVGADGQVSADDIIADFRPRMAVSKIVWWDTNQDGTVNLGDSVHFYVTRPGNITSPLTRTGLTSSWGATSLNNALNSWVSNNRIASYGFVAPLFTPGSDTVTISEVDNTLYDNNASSWLPRRAKNDSLKIYAP